MRISDWSSDVCSSDLDQAAGNGAARRRCACLAQIPGQGLSGSHERNPSARDVGGCEGAPTRLTCRPQMDAAFTAGSNPARRRRAKPPELRQSCVFRYALSSKIATGEKSDPRNCWNKPRRSEEHTSELQSLMLISYAVFCLKKKKTNIKKQMKTKQHNSTTRHSKKT